MKQHTLRVTHDDGTTTYLQHATTVTERVSFGALKTAHVFKSEADARSFAALFYLYKKDWFGLIVFINAVTDISPELYVED